MRVILLQDVRKVGRKNEIKNVADGYGKNVLIPKGWAKLATPEDIRNVEFRMLNAEKENQEKKEKLLILAKELAKKTFEIKVKADGKGAIFGSVGEKEIMKTLEHENMKTLKHENMKAIKQGDIKILLDKPIKSLGEHLVAVNLGFGITAKIKVVIKKEE